MPADARLAKQKTHRVKHTKPHLLSLKLWMHQPARHHMVQGSEVRRQYCPRSGTRLEGALPYDAITPWLPLLAPKIWTGWRPLHIQKRRVHNKSVQQSTKCGVQLDEHRASHVTLSSRQISLPSTQAKAKQQVAPRINTHIY